MQSGTRLAVLLAAPSRVVQGELRVKLALDVRRQEPALEESLGLVRMMLGTLAKVVSADSGDESCEMVCI